MKQNRHFATKCIGKLKLSTQLIILVSIQVLIIVSYVLALNLIHHSLLINYLTEVSDYMFEDNSNHLLSNMMEEYIQHFNQVFNLNGNALVSFHRLYHTTKNQVLIHPLEINPFYQMQYGGTTKIPDPLRIIKGYGNYDISYSFMCYSNLSSYHHPKTIEEIVGIKLQEQIQATGQIFYQGNLINQSFLYSYIMKEKINSIYPCLNRDKAIYQYVPEKRDWYLELKKNYESKSPYNRYNYTFTQPYLLYTDKKIGLSMTLPIVDRNLSLIGGVVSNFLGSQHYWSLNNLSCTAKQKILFSFPIDTFIYIYKKYQKKKNQKSNVSEKGVMIMHPYQVTVEQLPLFIYNESITGFNLTDWEYILNLSSVSSCPIFDEVSSLLKCRYNSYSYLSSQHLNYILFNNYNYTILKISYKMKSFFHCIRDIPEFKMKLIMLLSSSEYLKFYDDFQQTLDQSLHNATNNNIIWLIVSFVIISLMIIVVTQILFHPIEIIKQQAISLINQQSRNKQQISEIAEVWMSDEILSLVQTYKIVINKLESLSLIKTNQCKEFEDIKYPTKQISVTQSTFMQTIEQTKQFQSLSFQNLKDFNKDQEFENISISIIQGVLKQQNTKFFLY